MQRVMRRLEAATFCRMCSDLAVFSCMHNRSRAKPEVSRRIRQAVSEGTLPGKKNLSVDLAGYTTSRFMIAVIMIRHSIRGQNVFRWTITVA
jgi:hypothetical protein